MNSSGTGSTPAETSEASISEASVSEAPVLEPARLEALRSFDVLDTLPEKDYDDLTQLAAEICHAPMSLISLIDENRQWFKSKVGLDADETALSLSFCRYALAQPDEVMVIPDTEKDAQFCNHPAVTGEPHIRFYAGAPLVSSEGFPLGTLCVADSVPHHFDGNQRKALQILARQVMAQLEMRRVLARSEKHARDLENITQKLRESEARFKAFMDNGPTVSFIKDESGCYLYANPLLLERFGKKWDEFVGYRDEELWPRKIYRAIHRSDLAVLRSGTVVASEEEAPLPDGSTSVWLAFKFPLHNAQGRRLLGGIGVDITESKTKERQLAEYRKRLEEAVAKLEIVAVTDSLTGLKNRGALMERLDEEVQRARRYNLPLSLALLDVDFFKSFNDSFGHPAGDEVLRCVAQILQRHARPSDFSARYGGEEFVVVLGNTALCGALVHAERIRCAIENENWPQRKITASIGVAALSQNIADGNALLRAADDALYQAKRAGRNRVAQAHDEPEA
jgi:diguanylate cyclase (GGDEF)-like protein/PAS domain S-box-containing protein